MHCSPDEEFPGHSQRSKVKFWRTRQNRYYMCTFPNLLKMKSMKFDLSFIERNKIRVVLQLLVWAFPPTLLDFIEIIPEVNKLKHAGKWTDRTSLMCVHFVYNTK